MEEMMNETELNWLGSSLGEELIMQDLLHNCDAPPIMLPWKSTEQEPTSTPNKHISPTIGDSKIAMSMMSCSNGELDGYNSYRPVIALPDKGLSTKMENKYTLRIKTCGNGVADDGYKWRKYGQKSIKNSPNPRSYYRCTNPRCNAKRQVERSTEDPEMLIITYEGLHLHYTYSHFFHAQPLEDHLSLTKKPKTKSVAVQPLVSQEQQMQPIVQRLEIREQLQASQDPVITGESQPQQDHIFEVDKFEGSTMRDEIMQEEPLYNVHCSQGLLEDIVPLMVRKPCSPATSSNEPSYSSQAYSPSYSSSQCWTPGTFHFAEGILSSIV